MKTDPLFYELFQTRPQIFFELAQITPPCPYRFESVTVKSAEKRIDGVLYPTVENQPLYFVEVQAAPDKQMYWRTSREVSTFFEQRPALQDTEWFAYVIWLDGNDDKGVKKTHIYDEQKKQRILSIHLIDILKKLPANSLALNVLRPLLVDTEQEVRQNITTWVEQIHQADLSPEAEQRLLMVMSQLIEEKFKILNYKELCKMLNLTPFTETSSFQEAFQERFQEKLPEKLKEDRVQRLIQIIDAKFRFSRDTINKLAVKLNQLTLDDLKNLFGDIFRLRRLKDLNEWLDQHLVAPQPNELANLQH